MSDMATIAAHWFFPPSFTSASFSFAASGTPDESRDGSRPADANAVAAGSTARPTVLVVDDETLIADSVAEILNRNGYDATATYSGTEAVKRVEEQCPDIVVTDVILPDYDGVRLAMAIRARCPNTRIVLFSGNAATSSLLDHVVTGGFFFELLTKPVHPAQLLKALKS